MATFFRWLRFQDVAFCYALAHGQERGQKVVEYILSSDISFYANLYLFFCHYYFSYLYISLIDDFHFHYLL